MMRLLDLGDFSGIAGMGDSSPLGLYPDMYGFKGVPGSTEYYNNPPSSSPSLQYYMVPPSGAPPAQQYYEPHGSINPNDVSNLYAEASRQIAASLATAPRQVNSGFWGVAGFGWTDKWPIPSFIGSAHAADYGRVPPNWIPEGVGGGGAGRPNATSRELERRSRASANSYDLNTGNSERILDTSPSVGDFNVDNVTAAFDVYEQNAFFNSFGMGQANYMFVPELIPIDPRFSNLPGNGFLAVGTRGLNLDTMQFDGPTYFFTGD